MSFSVNYFTKTMLLLATFECALMAKGIPIERDKVRAKAKTIATLLMTK